MYLGDFSNLLRQCVQQASFQEVLRFVHPAVHVVTVKRNAG